MYVGMRLKDTNPEAWEALRKAAIFHAEEQIEKVRAKYQKALKSYPDFHEVVGYLPLPFALQHDSRNKVDGEGDWRFRRALMDHLIDKYLAPDIRVEVIQTMGKLDPEIVLSYVNLEIA